MVLNSQVFGIKPATFHSESAALTTCVIGPHTMGACIGFLYKVVQWFNIGHFSKFILSRGDEFESVTAWNIHMKRDTLAYHVHGYKNFTTDFIIFFSGAKSGIISKVNNSCPNVICLIWEGGGWGPFRLETDKIVTGVNRFTIAVPSRWQNSGKKNGKGQKQTCHIVCFLDVMRRSSTKLHQSNIRLFQPRSEGVRLLAYICPWIEMQM